ncbi:MAG: hypothetical protein CL868_13160 [Cytophagaceae bacterium]|nr:hypothetical protein [Cytophagaceae bacterium]
MYFIIFLFKVYIKLINVYRFITAASYNIAIKRSKRNIKVLHESDLLHNFMILRIQKLYYEFKRK